MRIVERDNILLSSKPVKPLAEFRKRFNLDANRVLYELERYNLTYGRNPTSATIVVTDESFDKYATIIDEEIKTGKLTYKNGCELPLEFSDESLLEYFRELYGDFTVNQLQGLVNGGLLERRSHIWFNDNTGEERYEAYYRLSDVLQYIKRKSLPGQNPSAPAEEITTTSAVKKVKTGKEPKPRRDALAKILHLIVAELRQSLNRAPQYIEVINKLKNLCRDPKHPVIQEVSESKIYWLNRSGKQKTTSYKQVQNRLTDINQV